MARFFLMDRDESVRISQGFGGVHKWGLPGASCPLCEAIWSGMSESYPATDLSIHPERKKFEKARLEKDFDEFERLRGLVRPLVPRSAILEPGTGFGPLVGWIQGTLGAFVMDAAVGTLLIRREALEQFQAAGVQGLLGCRTELRWRRKNPPEYLELQIEPAGLLHPDCLPPGKARPCAKCGRHGFRRPDDPLLDAASLPEHLDVFRLINYMNILVVSERFLKEALRLDLTGIVFSELPLR